MFQPLASEQGLVKPPPRGPPASVVRSSSWSSLGEAHPLCLMLLCRVHLPGSFSKPMAHTWASAGLSDRGRVLSVACVGEMLCWCVIPV